MNEIEAKTSQLLADMAHATAWLNFTTATANHDLERFGKWDQIEQEYLAVADGSTHFMPIPEPPVKP